MGGGGAGPAAERGRNQEHLVALITMQRGLEVKTKVGARDVHTGMLHGQGQRCRTRTVIVFSHGHG
jgi:hypothetical protein